MRIGVDTGGTFTDFVVFDPASGQLDTFKRLSTPHDPAAAILDGLAQLAGNGQRHIVHGSTVATNAVLERKGAKVALVNTQGFRDLLQIGRQNRPALYDFLANPPAPLVPRADRLEVAERIAADGRVQTPLDEAALDALVAHCQREGIEAVAICLLFSFANPAHEQAVAARFAAAGFNVSVSHHILPEFREYERASTTVLNAYVSPVMSRYLNKLAAALPADHLQIMQSNGGMAGPRLAGEQAVRCILSGPAGGLVGAQAVAGAAGYARILTFDMGGTSTDVALIDGAAQVSRSSQIGGLPVHVPMLAIHTVGSGGGSIAWRDAGGGLQVGPHSAGADPGPAAYGRGELPTVTDANVLLGRIRPDQFFGGRMPLDTARAEAAFARLAAELGISVEECQLGAVHIANAHMARALRVISVEKGHDPRDFTLLAFGGAGGLHAADLARALGMPRVLAPRHAATLSALGMLLADVVKDYSRTVMLPGVTPAAELDMRLAPLLSSAQAELAAEGVAAADMQFQPSADLRYAGQSFELNLPLGPQLLADFHRAHQEAYGYHDVEAAVEIVNLRVQAIGLTQRPHLPAFEPSTQPIESCVLGHYPVRFASGLVDTPFYDGARLGAGQRFAGPAVVVRPDTTILVGEGDHAEVDAFLNLVITIGGVA
ncbi:MAG: hydantoinase/oxoprolinase family protein [Anaerolineales bacterium]|nr:hydantoinase/oxoprolinase family protein [Anaerolineales bacterium]